MIDELPSLQKLPSLSDFLARARKYGGCGILGFQSYPQLEATYGIQDAAAITGYCSTWVALRANDTPTAKHVSENLGQVEQVEANEGMSYGVNDMRDGVNLSRVQVTRPLVMHTEVTNLANLSGYLRFGRDLPVVRFADKYNNVPSISDAFIERKRPPLRFSPPPVPSSPSAPASATSPATRKRIKKQAAQPPTPELPFDRPLQPVPDSSRNGRGVEAEQPVDEQTPGRPPASYDIVGPRWNHSLRQHGRPDGRRTPSRPA